MIFICRQWTIKAEMMHKITEICGNVCVEHHHFDLIPF